MTLLPTQDQDLGYMSVLVAGHEELSNIMLQRILTKWRANVSVAHSEPEIESKLKSEQFELLITDTQMAYDRAVEVVREIEEHGGPHVPIIVSADEDFQNKSGDNLDDEVTFLNKPFTSEKLFKTINSSCEPALSLPMAM